MQPTYLPWAGYFNLIRQVDVFVFLDDVQFEHQSWQTRNAILLGGRRHLLVAPVERAPLATLVRDIRLAKGQVWRRKHLGTLEAAYARAPHGREMLDTVAPVIADASIEWLSDLNQRLIGAMCQAGGLAPRFLRSSALDCAGTRSERLLRICATLGCDRYLSPVGSAGYLAEDRFEDNPSVALEFQAFQPGPYPQRGTADFVSHLSMVDVAANLGWRGAMEYAESGHVQ